MIRYKLNKNTGHLIPSFPNVVTLLQVFGVGLLLIGVVVRWLVFKEQRLVFLEEKHSLDFI